MAQVSQSDVAAVLLQRLLGIGISPASGSADLPEVPPPATTERPSLEASSSGSLVLPVLTEQSPREAYSLLMGAKFAALAVRTLSEDLEQEWQGEDEGYNRITALMCTVQLAIDRLQAAELIVEAWMRRERMQ